MVDWAFVFISSPYQDPTKMTVRDYNHYARKDGDSKFGSDVDTDDVTHAHTYTYTYAKRR